MKNWLEDLYKRKYENQKPHICLPGVKKFVTDLLYHMYPAMGQLEFKSVSDLETSILENKKFFIKIVKCQAQVTDEKAEKIADEFYSKLADIEKKLELDSNYINECDPACLSTEEVVAAYPGFYAIACYRIAHEILRAGFPIFSRMITEIAHEKTGVDIHPGASIETPFFIDHGTGVVIGETTVIGKNVRIYQGVTLGALSVSKDLQGSKRHPTVEDDVIIYSNATILGGKTIIGKGTTIGGNVWISKTISPSSFVYHDSVVTTKVKES